jgi:3'-phosphoadenosine 5'-phosphosulfate sulfotransferase (PAPS reductase)/FAD synthetase
MNLQAYDYILGNTSGGKDSTAMISFLARECVLWGFPPSRLILVHADLGEAEWEGTTDLVREHAEQLGLRLEIVRRDEELLDYVERRRKWPSPQQRYCTSDFKRGPIAKIYTKLAKEMRDQGAVTHRPVEILNCMGFRADESPARAKRPVLAVNTRQSNGRKTVTDWLPIHTWDEETVWDEIRASGLRHHRAYDLGMPRLSCAFCIFAPKEALLIAGKHNPALLDKYVRVEREIEHQFRGEPGKSGSLSLADIQEELVAGQELQPVTGWGNQ